MSKVVRILLAMGLVVSAMGVTAWGQLGPSELPCWAHMAQVKLGWVFADPKNPQDSSPLSGWDEYIGAAPPTWAYDPCGEAAENPGQWSITIPNVDDTARPKKHFWLCYVYERDPDYIGTHAFNYIEWAPNAGWEPVVYPGDEELFDINGVETDNAVTAAYVRVTMQLNMLPNPTVEDIWLGVLGDYTAAPSEPAFGQDGYDLVEVYVITQCVPEATVWSGLSETFTKLSYADWTLPENQDRITDGVWLTRANYAGLFNAAMESSFDDDIAPACTEWAYGSAENWETLMFEPWALWHGWYPLTSIGEDAVLHLIAENIYIDIEFLFWVSGEGAGGGGISYMRGSPCQEYPAADLTGDCRVDLADLAVLATDWLECNLSDWTQCWGE